MYTIVKVQVEKEQHLYRATIGTDHCNYGTGGLEKHWHCNKQKEGSNIVTEYISHRKMKKTEKGPLRPLV